MPLNPFFNNLGSESERSLQEDLFIEFVQQRGVECIYFPKVYLTEDIILNEVVNHYHSRGMMIEMLLTEYMDWEDNSVELTTFGLMNMPNEAIFEVSKFRFKECVAEERLQFSGKPNEGDLIYVPKLKEFFSIKKVKKDDPTKLDDRWVLKTQKYDDENSVNIDTSDFVQDFGTNNPNQEARCVDNVFGDSVEEFLNRDFAKEYNADPNQELKQNAKDLLG